MRGFKVVKWVICVFLLLVWCVALPEAFGKNSFTEIAVLALITVFFAVEYALLHKYFKKTAARISIESGTTVLYYLTGDEIRFETDSILTVREASNKYVITTDDNVYSVLKNPILFSAKYLREYKKAVEYLKRYKVW